MRLFKYQVIEYEVKKMTNKEIEYTKYLHQTNSKLLYYVIILCMKLSRIKYKTVKRSDITYDTRNK